MAFTIDLKTWLKTLVYEKDEVDTLLEGKSDVGHTHGDIYYTETEVDTLLEAKADAEDVPTKVSELTNDTGFITAAAIAGKEDTSNKVTSLSAASTDDQYVSAKAAYDELQLKQNAADAFSGDYDDLTNKPSIPTVDSALNAESGNAIANSAVTTALNGKAASTHNHQITDITNLDTTLAGKVDESDLATVATSGSYNDLSNKPTLSDLGGVVTVEKQTTAETGYTATYIVKQNNVAVGTKINIPKDFLVKSATVETCTTKDEPETGYNVGDKYLDFVINTKDGSATDEHLYVNVKDLIDTYTADESTLTLSGNTFSIKDGGVSRAKLATAVTNELDSKLEASDIDVQFNTTSGILTISVGE